MIYGTRISNNYQEIRRIERVIKIPEIHIEKMLMKKNSLEIQIKQEKKRYIFVLLGIFVMHLLYLLFLKEFSAIEIRYAAILLFSYFLCYLIINWLKGRDMLSALPNSEGRDYDTWL